MYLKKRKGKKNVKRKKDRVFSFPFSFFSFFFLFFLVFFRKPLRVKISLALDDFASRFKSKASGIRAQRIRSSSCFQRATTKKIVDTRPTDIQGSSRHATRIFFSLSLSLSPFISPFYFNMFQRIFCILSRFPFFSLPSPLIRCN